MPFGVVRFAQNIHLSGSILHGKNVGTDVVSFW